MRIADYWRRNNVLLKMMDRPGGRLKEKIIVSSLVKGLQPYVHLILFSRIIDAIGTNELAGAKTYIWMILLIDLALGLISHYLDEKIKTVKLTCVEYVNQKLADSCMTMPYSRIEDPKTQDALAKADAGKNGSGDFDTVISSLCMIGQNLVTVVAALAMVVYLFAQTGYSSSFIDSTGALLILAGLYLLMVTAGYFVNSLYNKRAILLRQENEHNNTVGSYLINYAFDESNSKDFRIGTLKQLWNSLIEVFWTKPLSIYLQWGKMSGAAKAAFSLLLGLVSGAAYFVIGGKALAGSISIGSVLMYTGAVTSLAQAASIVVGEYTSSLYCLDYLEIVAAFINDVSKPNQAGRPVEPGEHVIEFVNVSFCYPGASEDVLTDISCVIKPHEKLAIVGRNGAGKSTFIKLLCRLYRPSAGYIMLDGLDIWDYDCRQYYQLFAVVFQDFTIFDLPLGGNIAGQDEIDRNKAEQALKQAGLQNRLDSGLTLESQLGKDNGDGIMLSGGESQKVAISRALYKDSPIVILDEPTSALDPFAEEEIYRNFAQMSARKTAVYISHRMSSCRFCERIMVFDRGQIVQQGSHDDLLGQAGLYQQLWQAQAQYYQQV